MQIPIKILQNARALRSSQTDAEQLLWYILRSRRFCGVKFRRQHPIGGYILDFYCHEALLGIELDGGGHTEMSQRQYDDLRTKVINDEGIKVLRFWNDDVLKNTENVLECIFAAVFPSPVTSCHPLPEGEGKVISKSISISISKS